VNILQNKYYKNAAQFSKNSAEHSDLNSDGQFYRIILMNILINILKNNSTDSDGKILKNSEKF
jgi:hypothetical protein